MNISEPFIKRPVMTTLVMSGILLFGIQAYRLLPVKTVELLILVPSALTVRSKTSLGRSRLRIGPDCSKH